MKDTIRALGFSLQSFISMHIEAPTAKPTILVVEDNASEQKVVGFLARHFGINAEIVGTGFRALQCLHEQYYDAVLMNYRLPAMSGPECALAIRKLDIERCTRVPIIAVTASIQDEALRNCLDSGMDDFLTKPYTVEQFQDIIDRWIVQPNERRALLA